LRVENHPDSSEKFIVSGRGELHLSVLIESMRREGYELEVSKPEVIFKEINGTLSEPFEELEISVPMDYQGSVMRELNKRFADITDIAPNEANTEITFKATITTRALIGLKSMMITETKGTVIMHNIFAGYKPKQSLELTSNHGSLVSTETGTTLGYALDNAQQRGVLFVGPAVDVYQGMVIGQCARDEDLELNPCKGKKLTNVRSKASDEGIVLTTPKILTLEEAIEYIGNDELVEITPLNIRIRKRYLNPNDRKKNK